MPEVSTMAGGESFLDPMIFTACFGEQGLGMPSSGLIDSELDIKNLEKFHSTYFKANDLIICGAGIDDHYSFVKLVEEKLKDIDFHSK